MLRVYRYRELLLAEVVSEILARYKQSLMGPMWALFQPLVLMVIFTLVRSLVGIESDGPSLSDLCVRRLSSLGFLR